MTRPPRVKPGQPVTCAADMGNPEKPGTVVAVDETPQENHAKETFYWVVVETEGHKEVWPDHRLK